MKKIIILLLFIPMISLANLLDLSDLPKDISDKIQKSYPQLLVPPISQEKLDELLRVIYRFNRYQSVEFIKSKKETTDIYKLILKKIPIIEDIQLQGDIPIDKKELLDKSGIQSGENYDPYRLRNSANRILEILRKNAYLNTKIEIVVNDGKKDKNNKIIYFQVNPGEKFQIGKIFIQTKNKTLKKKIINISEDYEKNDFTEQEVEELKEEITDYLIDNNYLDSSLSEPKFEFDRNSKKTNISYSIKNHHQFQLNFIGNENFSKSILLRKLDFSKSEPLGINPGADISERIKKIYKNSGYANIEITQNTKVDATKYQKIITFHITEGNLIKIKDYVIEGNSVITDKEYENLIKKFSGKLISKDTYHAEQLDAGLADLITYLQNQGFLRARLLTQRVAFNKKKTKVSVYIRIDEGPRSILNTVSFHGASFFTKEQLLKVVNLKEKEPLLLEELETGIDKIKDFYKENGFLEIQIDQNNKKFIEYNDNNTKANLNFFIQEGDQIITKEISISGNKQTKDQVILSGLDFKIGEVLTSEKIKKSESNLRRLGIFKSVTIRAESGSSSQRKILVVLNERNPGTLTFGAGVSNELELTARGYTGIAYRNLFGTARAIQTRFELNSNIKANEFIDYKINASYLEPFLFNTQTKGKINILNSETLTSTSTIASKLEARNSTALEFLLEKDITRFFKLTWKLWGIEKNRTFRVEDKSIQDATNIAEIGPTLEFDFRDNPFVPKSGTYTRFNLNYSSPLLGSTEVDEAGPDNKTVHYIKTSLQFNHYFSISKEANVTFAYSLRGGYLKNMGKDGLSAVPKEKLFFLGGISTIRGFETNTIPNDTLLIESGDDFASVSTESTYYLLKAEIRVPIKNNFGLALFYDGGGVQVQKKDLGDPYRDAVGVSLQYLTPIGAINLGYGYKLDRNFEANESEGEIFFSIGDF